MAGRERRHGQPALEFGLLRRPYGFASERIQPKQQHVPHHQLRVDVIVAALPALTGIAKPLAVYDRWMAEVCAAPDVAGTSAHQ
eukprot:CAMPEP_0117659984 /NCGR_PEP_ID=MMETSP0804-20121206/6722_1 /TAXON_ID=1074897 /ORGANISM="Tetraselmis astigmatica, Strain CCMP880" /LENGTH=83 /DNA_ID=CAMNT_0005466675 /DNA_START=370 /DNA_END=620 /DNA_ORIENTATION=+